MEVLCRDVMKRLRDDQTKRDPTRKKKFDSNYTANSSQGFNQFSNGAQPDISGVGFGVGPHDALIQAAAHAQAQAQVQAQAQAAAAAHVHHAHSQGQVMADHSDMQIDPSLLLAAANDPSLIDQSQHGQFSEQQYADQQYAAQAAQASFPPSPTSIAVYFRLHPASDVRMAQRLWVATLSSISVDELRGIATLKTPNAVAVRIEGIVKEPNGQEMTLQIDEDQELDAYLSAIQGVKPIFTVQLMTWKNE